MTDYADYASLFKRGKIKGFHDLHGWIVSL
jgi:hypothetical protein